MRKLTLLWAWKIWAYCRVSSSWGFQGVMQWKTLAIIIYLLFVLDFAITSKYTPHLFTSEILLMAGVLVGVSLERLVGDIPHLWWAVFIWLAIAVAVGVFWPFPAPDKQVADGVGR